VQLDPITLAEDATLMPRIMRNMRENGVLSRALATGAIQVSPSFVISRAELRMIASAIDSALVTVGSRRTPSMAEDDDLLPHITTDELGGFGNSDARLLADVPPHHGS
jgi:hypothetical protein